MGEAGPLGPWAPGLCPQSSIGCDATAGAGLGMTDSGLALEV